jgi:hypothetical protein
MRLVIAIIVAVAVLIALILVFACGGRDDDGRPQPTPVPTETAAGGDEAQQALGRYVQTTLQRQFVPECARADAAQDVGKICAAFRGERGLQRAYVIGNTFSEFHTWVILEDRQGQWAVVSARPITPDTAANPGVPWPLRTGVDLVVVGGGCLNVREGPGLNQPAVDCINDGTIIRLNAGPNLVDNIEWWQVSGRSGWVSGDYLRYPDARE